MTRVRRRARTRREELDHMQWFELMLLRSGTWQHFDGEDAAREAWFAHRDELLGELQTARWSSSVRFPAAMERFEAPPDLHDAAGDLARGAGLNHRAAMTAAEAVWMTKVGALDPSWIETALTQADEPSWYDGVIGSGQYLRDALRTFLAAPGPWSPA